MSSSDSHRGHTRLIREMRTRSGEVPRQINGTAVGLGQYLLEGDLFLFWTPEEIGFLYERGAGITLQQPADSDFRDVDLWLNGTVYAAVAAMNGIMPVHASAVAYEGRVYAFSGPSGAGKSTLVAALGSEGLVLFCDDILLMDYSGDTVLCLPSQKRLKLWPEGVGLSGALPLQQVSSDYPKYFSLSSAGVSREVLPLGELIFLERGPSFGLSAVPPGESMAMFQDDHYTAQLFEQASGLTRSARFAQLAQIVSRMTIRRFVRPFAADRFFEGVQYIARHVREEPVF